MSKSDEPSHGASGMTHEVQPVHSIDRDRAAGAHPDAYDRLSRASGKTEFTKSLEAGFARAGIKCKVIILVGSIREPQDFGGFPVSTPDGVRLLPMAWARDAKRLAEDGYLVVVFLDELTTVPPTTQAAMLRLLTENVCGELAAAGLRAGQRRRRLPLREQCRGVGRRRPGNPAADGEPAVAWRVPDGPRNLVRDDGQRLPATEHLPVAAGRLPALTTISSAR